MLRSHTIEILKTLDISERKKKGQYFTNKYIRDIAFNTLPNIQFSRILEPSFGTGEFLLDLYEKYPKAIIEGYEIDEKLYDFKEGLVCGDFLQNSIVDETYDLVIGNPPYFQLEATEEQLNKYSSVIGGRPNIFAFFFYEGIRLLKPNGWLCYVVPVSMCTGRYFSALRKYITNSCGVMDIKSFAQNEFADAQQSVIVITLQKNSESKKGLVYERNGEVIFNHHGDSLLEEAFDSGTTLKEMNFVVKTGNLVWNQWKDYLTDKGIKLLWSYNIGKNGDLIEQTCKPQYVSECIRDKIKPYIGPALLVKRTLGTVGKGKINAAIVSKDIEFYAENHVNVIWHDDYKKLDVLLKELLKPITSELARRITGNTQLSKTELNNLLPFCHEIKRSP